MLDRLAPPARDSLARTLGLDTATSESAAAPPVQPAFRSAFQQGSESIDTSRRRLFRRAGSLVAALGAATQTPRAWGAPPTSVASDVDPGSLLSRLVKRVTLGLNQNELTLASQLGYSGYLERQLDFTSIDDAAMDTRLTSLTTLNMTPLQLMAQSSGILRNELIEAMILRSTFSNRQLLQRMVEFWTDHFNIDINQYPASNTKTTDDRTVIRANALGTFPALLGASARSPAMLTYLDNDLSTALAPNENYAREIMELHTLGVDGGYTQQDVLEVAKCFSGWTYYGYNATNPDPRSGEFRFNSSRHTSGPKYVLGNTITVGGMGDGLAVLDILAAHPNTAKYVSAKMCRWFLGDDVPQGVINSVAATYTATGGDIKAMVRTLLSVNVLADAPLRYKRPYHLICSAMRALPTTITTTSSLRSQLAGMGNLPFYWSTPDGYPDTTSHWVGLIVPRWNYGFLLANNSIAGVSVDTPGFFAGLTTSQQLVDKLDQALFGGEMPAYDKNRIRTYIGANATSATTQRDAVGLAIASPAFQWY